MKISHLKDLWQEFNINFFAGSLRPVTFRLTRGRKCFGSFVHTTNSGAMSIRISSPMNKDPVILADTLLHEMCHQYLYETTGDLDQDHGVCFQLIAKKLGIQS